MMEKRLVAGGETAFTLIEMLVILTVIALLTAILIPALAAAKNLAKMTVCKSHLRQLALANQNYAHDNRGHSVPGAINIDTINLHRWYGSRPSVNDPFDPAKGPLGSYLEHCQLECPHYVRYSELPASHEHYEGDNGGYGYNFIYVGSRIWYSGLETPDSSTSMKLTDIQQPASTLLFTDTAFVINISLEPAFIRYAFAEPRYFVVDKEPTSAWSPAPSIHFRHRGRACIAWADGHADAKKTAHYDGTNEDGTRPADFDLGWFEPMDNSLFDLK
jgi:prepilin-type processing-associated H-X9-DG protein